ncbi:MAG: hypothetical protein ED555_11395 [Allomuricauda sp.]|nr:MAG: hypothetical protein ED555_11395 [Allomuricauda sp.]
MAQNKAVYVVEETQGNRMSFYAHNEDYKDYDVLFTIKGSDFRQSKAKPRWIRLPSASRVHLKTIFLFRGKKPVYSHSLQLNDSLSRRALRKEYTQIEIPPKMIQPKRHITVYITESCSSCDSLVAKLETNLYIFKHFRLSEKPTIKEYLSNTLVDLETPIDSLQNPIVNLGGYLYTRITDYESLLEELNKSE